MTTTAVDLIALSRREDRTVTAHPATWAEHDSLLDALLAESEGDADTAEHGGSRTEIWSADGWRVELHHPQGVR